MAVYAVGDIQGCYSPLASLLDTVNFDPAVDTLLCVGDLVNRGPESLKVINLLKSLKNQCLTVLGNHDIHLLSMVYGIREPKRLDTTQDILNSSETHDVADWLRQKPLMIRDDQLGFAVCHAGIYPWWSINQAESFADEVHQKLKHEQSCIKLLKKVYGNKPNKWDSSFVKTQRMRFIINAFTRMRFCSPKGHLNFNESGYHGKIRKNRLPWFDIPNQHGLNHRIIFGHWSALGLLNKNQFLGLDTGYVWGRYLTMARLPESQDSLNPIEKQHFYRIKNRDS